MSEGFQISSQLQLLGLIVIIALVIGALATKLGFSSSLGYILAGIAVGPLGLGFFTGETAISTIFAELGLTLLLFYLGLELTLSRFRKTGALALVLSSVQMFFAFVAGFFIAKMFGFTDLEAILVGSLLPMASTVVAAKFLIEKNLIDTFEGRVALSVLIIEDFAGILLLVFLNSFLQEQSVNTTVLNGVFFVIAAYYLVQQMSKHVLKILEGVGQSDKVAIYAIAVGVGVSFLGESLGLSNIVGAYFAGFALAESHLGERIRREIGFFREFFVLFFFLSFGASTILPASPDMLLLLIALVAAYFAVIIVSFGVVGTALGFSPQDAVKMGLAHAVIGEFSLIIAGTAKVLAEKGGPMAGELARASEIASIAFMLTITTSIIMPLLFAHSDRIAGVFSRIYPQSAQRVMRALGRKMRFLEAVEGGEVFKNAYARTMKSLATNGLIVFAIFYLASVKELQKSVDWFSFIPDYVTVGMILIPVVIWPLYRFVKELKVVARTVSSRAVDLAFPSLKGSFEIHHRAADLFAGVILSISGFAATIYTYYHLGLGVIFVAPALYTLVSLMYLSKSFYSLMEHYEAIEAGLEMEYSATTKRMHNLSNEFNEHSRRLRNLHLQRMQAREEIESALKEENFHRARAILTRLKRSEKNQLVSLLSEEDLLHALPPSAFYKYPQYARKIFKFNPVQSLKKYMQRHQFSKNELKEFEFSSTRRHEVQRQIAELERVKNYLQAKKQAMQARLSKTIRSSKAIQASKNRKINAIKNTRANLQSQDFAAKLRSLPKLSLQMPRASKNPSGK